MAEEPHILLVDDERDIRDPLAAYLSKGGLRVSKAENAAAARQILSAYAIDLVLLDIMMPGEDGLRWPAISARPPRCRSSSSPTSDRGNGRIVGVSRSAPTIM